MIINNLNIIVIFFIITIFVLLDQIFIENFYNNNNRDISIEGSHGSKGTCEDISFDKIFKRINITNDEMLEHIDTYIF